MTPNIGTIDRTFRIILGVVLLLAPLISGISLFQSGTMTTLSVIIGLVMLGTSAIKFCPLYRILGMRTCK